MRYISWFVSGGVSVVLWPRREVDLTCCDCVVSGFCEMMWLLFAVLLVFARHADCGALRCSEGSSCTVEEESKAPPTHTKAVVDLSPQEAECQPGSEWDSNCHYCRCSDSGIAECLRQDACDKGISVEPIRCKPNSTVERDCNTCICLEDGLGLCTLKSCSRIASGLPSGEDCAPGTSWLNECNHCRCTDDGVGYCTLKGCISSSEPARLCAPNTSWKKECNICHCSDDGRVVCTEMRCKQQAGSNLAELDKGSLEHTQRSRLQALTTEIRVEKRETRCKPNAEFKSECNNCKCSASGTSFSCTQNECLEGDSGSSDVEVFQETDGADHIERHSVCQPFTIFYVACNTCRCDASGTDFACTLKSCPLPKDVEVFHELRISRSAVNTTKAVICVANRMFIKDCNTCWCNEDGTSFYCTRRVCTVPDDDQEDAQKATQASLSRQIRASQEVPKQCQPGQEFRMDCNKCLCDNEGQNFSCTRMDCNAPNNHNGDAFSSARTKRETEKEEVKCVPGSVFDRGCNVCRCTAEGQHAVCTMKICRHEDGTGHALEQDQGFRCNPGEQFAHECNDCTCSADGRSVFCTLRLCDV